MYNALPATNEGSEGSMAVNLPPGKELDIEVAKRVMGEDVSPVMIPMKYKVTGRASGSDKVHDHGTIGMETSMRYIKPYSTDISAAWEIVEKLSPSEDEFRLSRFHNEEWYCTFAYFKGWEEIGATAPHAICLAALKAVGHQE